MFKDYYLILGIGKDATTEEIEKAFESAKVKSNGDALKDVQEAYAVLSKRESKALYDEELEAFNKSDNYEDYQIQNQELAHIIEALQADENDDPMSSGCADKMRKGCMWVLMFIVFFILHTCVGAIMKQKGREAVKNSYSYVIPQK